VPWSIGRMTRRSTGIDGAPFLALALGSRDVPRRRARSRCRLGTMWRVMENPPGYPTEALLRAGPLPSEDDMAIDGLADEEWDAFEQALSDR